MTSQRSSALRLRSRLRVSVIPHTFLPLPAAERQSQQQRSQETVTPKPPRTNITTAPVFPGDAADGAAVVGASASARTEAVRHGWRVLAILSALMGFASISTDLYLPAMPAMGRALRADAGMVEWTISGYLIGFSLAWANCSGAQSATVMAAVCRWRSGSC